MKSTKIVKSLKTVGVVLAVLLIAAGSAILMELPIWVAGGWGLLVGYPSGFVIGNIWFGDL